MPNVVNSSGGNTKTSHICPCVVLGVVLLAGFLNKTHAQNNWSHNYQEIRPTLLARLAEEPAPSALLLYTLMWECEYGPYTVFLNITDANTLLDAIRKDWLENKFTHNTVSTYCYLIHRDRPWWRVDVVALLYQSQDSRNENWWTETRHVLSSAMVAAQNNNDLLYFPGLVAGLWKEIRTDETLWRTRIASDDMDRIGIAAAAANWSRPTAIVSRFPLRSYVIVKYPPPNIAMVYSPSDKDDPPGAPTDVFFYGEPEYFEPLPLISPIHDRNKHDQVTIQNSASDSLKQKNRVP